MFQHPITNLQIAHQIMQQRQDRAVRREFVQHVRRRRPRRAPACND